MDEKKFRRWLEDYVRVQNTTVEQLEKDFDIDDLYDIYESFEQYNEREDEIENYEQSHDIDHIGYEEDLTEEEHAKYRAWLEKQAESMGMTVEELEEDFDFEQLYNGYYQSEHPETPRKETEVEYIGSEQDLTEEEHSKYRAWLEEQAQKWDMPVERLEEDFDFEQLYNGYYQSEHPETSRKGTIDSEQDLTEEEHSKYRAWLEEQAQKWDMPVERLEEDLGFEQLYSGYSQSQQQKIDSEHDEDYDYGLDSLDDGNDAKFTEHSKLEAKGIHREYENGEVKTVSPHAKLSPTKPRVTEKEEKRDSKHPKLQYHETEFDDDFRILVDDADIGYGDVRDAVRITDELQRHELERMEREGKGMSEREQRQLQEMREEAERQARESSDFGFRGRF